jgi:phospholipid/cholesterol/gamma-HCH transport system substrate-binding protein
MENKSHALAAGLFVLALTALLIAAAVWLTRDTRTLREFELTGAINVTGLQPQASVRFRGVPVGKVITIGLDPQVRGQVLIRIAVDNQAPISTTTFAALGVQGVTGLAFIALDDPSDASQALPTAPQVPGRIPLRPGLMSKLTDQGERLLGQLEQSSQRFNQLLSPANQQTLINSVERIGLAAADLQQLSQLARQQWPAVAQSGLETLTEIKATSKRVGDSANEARASALAFRRVTERMYAPGGTLDQLDQGANILVATGQTLRINTLPRVNQAVQEASQTTHQLGELAQTLTDNPQAMLLGKPSTPPGPGEPGFVVPAASPR